MTGIWHGAAINFLLWGLYYFIFLILEKFVLKKWLDKLIKREIEAREWFVFCESEAANSSEYVRMEKEYIKSCRNKKIWTIDMDLPLENILKKVDEICIAIRVFISYTRVDTNFIAKRLEHELIEKDFDVWTDEDFINNSLWIDEVKENIKVASKSGYIIVLFSEKYLDSNACMLELKEIIKEANMANIIIVKIGNIELPNTLKKYHCISFANEPEDKDISSIINKIEDLLKLQLS